jgi:hypothetical protein
MRRFKFQHDLKIKSNTSLSANGHKLPDTDLDQIKTLMLLRKTSSFFRNALKNKIDETN